MSSIRPIESVSQLQPTNNTNVASSIRTTPTMTGVGGAVVDTGVVDAAFDEVGDVDDDEDDDQIMNDEVGEGMNANKIEGEEMAVDHIAPSTITQTSNTEPTTATGVTRKRRRVISADEDDEGDENASEASAVSSQWSSPAIAIQPKRKQIKTTPQREILSMISEDAGSTSSIRAIPISPSHYDDEASDDEVQIIDTPLSSRSSTPVSASTTPTPKPVASTPTSNAKIVQPHAQKRARVAPLATRKIQSPYSTSSSPHPISPTAPPMEIVTPGSPSAPLLSPIIPKENIINSTSHDEKDLDALEAEAVERMRQQKRASASSSPMPESSSTSTSITAASTTAGGIRRRKATNTSAAVAASSFASASLMHSYTGFTPYNSTVDPSLIWHEQNQVVLPANASDRTDIERTFLQQVLVWDPHVSSPFNRTGDDAKRKEKERELKSFAKFLDLANPLPVHFTSPLAYLGYFGPIILEDFRSQLVQTVEENIPPPRAAVTASKVAGKAATSSSTKPDPPSSSIADRHRSCWHILNLQSCPAVNGGGDDWFELRLKLAQAHPSIGHLSGADIVVLGIDEPSLTGSAAPPTTKKAATTSASVHIPPPSPSTVYIFAFLDRVDPEGSSCYCRLRIYLPGVGSALSSYVAASSSNKNNRFQIFYNRLHHAALTSSNAIEEGAKNSNANFTALGTVKRGADSKNQPAPQPIYLTRVDTIVTTIREYSALVKVACGPPLRILNELLHPSPGDQDDDESEQGVDEKRVIDVTSPSPDSETSLTVPDGPPPLESIAQVIKKERKKAQRASPASLADKLDHLDSTAWRGLPTGFREFVRTILNPQQLKAIQVALQRYENPGFTLLQGPPGTGKSKTVVALLNALHLGAFLRHYDSLIANVVEGQPIIPKPRILVCAPSNTAVDELITRVVETGVQYRPPSVAGGGTIPPGSTEEKKVALSAASPSNAATVSADSTPLSPDQAILASLKGRGGFVDGQRMRYTPDIVRVGNTDAIRPELKNVISLDALVDGYHRLSESDLQRRLSSARGYIATMEHHLKEACTVYHATRAQMNEMKATLDQLSSLGHDPRASPQLQQYEKLRADFLRRQGDLAHIAEKRLQAIQDVDRCQLSLRFKNAARELDLPPTSSLVRKEREAAIDSLRISFLNGAQIVFCTLSGSGLDLLSRLDQPFKALIIDEAAQSTEVSTLIPLIHDVQHCILVGDPRQLPATVFSLDTAAKRMWERSLFERLEQAGHQLHSLTTQYRMHGEIRRFPSEYFYQNALKDAEFISKGSLYKQPYHPNIDFQPILFYDLQSSSARGGPNASGDDSNMRSLGNVKEATFVVDLLAALLLQFPKVNPKQIGIITFYQKQKQLLQEELKKRAGLTKEDDVPKPKPTAPGATPAPPISPFLQIEVSTVDGFQGREKEIIVVSCVRGGSHGSLGFVDDVRRMNVALTRAKYSLWVVGDSRALKRSPHWNAFLESCAKRNRYQTVTGEEFAAYKRRPQIQPPSPTNFHQPFPQPQLLPSQPSASSHPQPQLNGYHLPTSTSTRPPSHAPPPTSNPFAVVPPPMAIFPQHHQPQPQTTQPQPQPQSSQPSLLPTTTFFPTSPTNYLRSTGPPQGIMPMPMPMSQQLPQPQFQPQQPFPPQPTNYPPRPLLPTPPIPSHPHPQSFQHHR